MFQSGLPHFFWGEAILHATYIINILSTLVLNWLSPHEKLYSQKADLSTLRIFGCLSYATNVNPHKTKLGPRAIKCVYLGVAANQKGYKMYDLGAKSLFTSRDVSFYEEVFPFSRIFSYSIFRFYVS